MGTCRSRDAGFSPDHTLVSTVVQADELSCRESYVITIQRSPDVLFASLVAID